MKKVDSIIGGMIKGGSLGRSVRLGEIWVSWDKIAGPDVAGCARPVKVVGRRLYVEVDGSPLHHRLSFLKGELLDRVRAFTGGNFIEDIIFQSRPRAGRKTNTPKPI